MRAFLPLSCRLYNKVFERLFPGSRLKNALWKAFLANSIADPVFFFPTFYTMREVISTGALSVDCMRKGLAKYSENYWDDWLNSWSIWIPAHCFKSAITDSMRCGSQYCVHLHVHNGTSGKT